MTISFVFLAGGSCLAQVVMAAGSSRSGPADTGQMLAWLLAAGVVIGLVCGLLVAASRFAHRWRYNSHPALFHGLCKVHGLQGASRRLLRRVARFHGLARPARLFVEPKWLDPTTLDASFQPRAVELEGLRCHLFSLDPAAEGKP